jgi:hypothetical protein
LKGDDHDMHIVSLFLHRFLKFSTCGIAAIRTHPAKAGSLLHKSEA